MSLPVALGAMLLGAVAWEQFGAVDLVLPPPPGTAPTALDVAIDRVVKNEASGRWDAINPTAGPPGIAVGPLQWTQQSTHLGRLLRRFYERDPRTFAAVILPVTPEELLAKTEAGSLEPVGGRYLWDPWWVGHITALLRHPPFVEVMRQEARTGIHMRKAIEAARTLGLLTLRGLTLTLDQAVRQGEYGVPALARRLAESWGGRQPPYNVRLQQWAEALKQRANASDVDRRVAAIIGDRSLHDGAVAV
jgi:hypothetical protein